MTPIKRSISFVVEGKPGRDGLSRLRCTIVWRGNRVRIALPHGVEPSKWEPSLQRCKAKSTHGKMRTPASVINRTMDDMEEKVNALFAQFERNDNIPDASSFKQAYDSRDEPDIPKDKNSQSIFPVYDIFEQDGTVSGRWSAGTLVKVKTIRNHLKRLNPNMTFNDLDEEGFSKLMVYFASVKDNLKQKGLTNRTINGKISFIKTFLNWAVEHDYCDPVRLQRQRVNLKTAKRPVVYLTWDELMEVYNHQFASRHLSVVRDVFCFCCFTSLRYSDVHNLKRANISDTAINITTVKTNDTITIELNKYSRTILDKYSDAKLPGEMALPVISNQKMNEALKVMGKECGLDSEIAMTVYKGQSRQDRVYKKWELLSTHAGRRTFVCNALMMGIPPDIVMKWTGHSDYKAMKPYIAIADSAKKDAMTAFDKK